MNYSGFIFGHLARDPHFDNVMRKKGLLAFPEGALSPSKRPPKKSKGPFFRENKPQNDTNSDTPKICEETWISVIVCDIVKVWSRSSCQKTTRKCPKINPALGWYRSQLEHNVNIIKLIYLITVDNECVRKDWETVEANLGHWNWKGGYSWPSYNGHSLSESECMLWYNLPWSHFGQNALFTRPKWKVYSRLWLFLSMLCV